MKPTLARNIRGSARKAPRSRVPASEVVIDLVPALLKVKSILVPTDFSESSLKAIDYTGVKHAFLGSTAERVVRHAPCPVLVVRQHERQFV